MRRHLDAGQCSVTWMLDNAAPLGCWTVQRHLDTGQCSVTWMLDNAAPLGCWTMLRHLDARRQALVASQSDQRNCRKLRKLQKTQEQFTIMEKINGVVTSSLDI